MDYSQYKDRFDRDGFVVVPQFLPLEEWAELNRNLDRYIAEIVPTLTDGTAYYDDPQRPETLRQLENMQQDPYFAAYKTNARWLALAEQLLGEPVESDSPKWFNKPPGAEHPTPPHQDNYYFCLEPPNVITLWIALDAVDEENGCLRYVVGSHRHGVRPHATSEILGFSQGVSDFGPDDEAKEISVRLQPGDLTAHHGEMIHRADPNHSTTRSRRAFAMVVRGRSCQLNEQRHTVYRAALDAQRAAKGR